MLDDFREGTIEQGRALVPMIGLRRSRFRSWRSRKEAVMPQSQGQDYMQQERTLGLCQ